MDESARTQVRSALKAAQTTLSEGLNCLRVASTTGPPEPLGGEGEFVALNQGFSVAVGGGQSGLFFPGGLGSVGCTILPSASTLGSFSVLPSLEGLVTSPLLSSRSDPYNRWYGGTLGGRTQGPPLGLFKDPRSCGRGGGILGDHQDGGGVHQ